MVPLKTNRRVLTWLCIYPATEGTSKWSELAHNIFTTSVFAYNLVAISISIGSFSSDDMEQFIFTVVHFVAELNSTYIFATTLILRHKITGMINHLIKIYQKRKIFHSFEPFKKMFDVWITELYFKIESFNWSFVKYTKIFISTNLDAINASMQYLIHANNLSEMMWTILLTYIMPIAIAFNMALAALSALISIWHHGGLVSNDLYHPFNKM